MTLEQLRIFVAVAEHQHVTRAAKELNLTQSATSAAIAALEARYAMKFFDRVGRRIELTETGRLFLVEARAVLAQAAAAEAVLDDLAGLKRGTLSIAASQTVANYWLPPRMHRFREAYPGISLRLKIGNTEQVTAWVNELAVDLGFVEGAIDNPALSAKPVAEDSLVLVAYAEHPWAAKRKVTREHLIATDWVLREPGSGTRSITEAALARLGVPISECKIALELPSNEAVLSAVENGAGATIVSEVAARAAIEAGTLLRRDIDLPKRQFYVLLHKERSANAAQRAFLDLIEGASRPQSKIKKRFAAAP
ncbi:MAG TPA: LysR family transcriptional regulator [Methylovirgula sp.]|jgi:DNA-binding transcriptional LysR family regulator